MKQPDGNHVQFDEIPFETNRYGTATYLENTTAPAVSLNNHGDSASVQIGSQDISINKGDKARINEEVELPVEGSRSSTNIEFELEFHQNYSIIAHPNQFLVPMTPETEELVEGLYSEVTSTDSDNQEENNVVITECPDSEAYGIQYNN